MREPRYSEEDDAMVPEGFPFHQFYLTYYSWCLVPVKRHPVLHHCVAIFFWSSGIMGCTCVLLTFENGVPLMNALGGVSGVASFITTDEKLQ